MPQFDEYARSITKGLAVSGAEKERICGEVVAHLEDEAARLEATGLPRAEAETKAVEEFGKDDVMAGMVSAALAVRQKRFKMRRMMAIAAALTASFALAPALYRFAGVYHHFYSDFDAPHPPQPDWVYYADVALISIAAIGLLLIVRRLSTARLAACVLSAGLIGAMYYALWHRSFADWLVYRAYPLYLWDHFRHWLTGVSTYGSENIFRWTVSDIWRHFFEKHSTLGDGVFFLIQWCLLFAALSLLAGVLAILLCRDRRQYVMAAICLAYGIVAGIGCLLIHGPHGFGLRISWPGYDLGLIALHAVLLTWLLTRGITKLFEKRGWIVPLLTPGDARLPSGPAEA